jgi:hypothetical protein
MEERNMNENLKRILEEAGKNSETAELTLQMIDKVTGGISDEEQERNEQEFWEKYELFKELTPEEIQELKEFLHRNDNL